MEKCKAHVAGIDFPTNFATPPASLASGLRGSYENNSCEPFVGGREAGLHPGNQMDELSGSSARLKSEFAELIARYAPNPLHREKGHDFSFRLDRDNMKFITEPPHI